MAISLEHKSITIDVNNRNAPNVVAIANVNDKAVRYLDVTLTASGNKLTFTDCTATATFATDGYLISDSVACTINSAADVITVPLENFNSTSGFLAIEIKIANGETQVLNTPLTLKVMVTPSLAENSKINSESAGSFADISREVATARGSSNSLGARLDTVDTNLAKKANKSDIDSINSRLQSTETTLKNKANITDMSNGLASKADKSTTLAQLSKLKDDLGEISNNVFIALSDIECIQTNNGYKLSGTGNMIPDDNYCSKRYKITDIEILYLKISLDGVCSCQFNTVLSPITANTMVGDVIKKSLDGYIAVPDNANYLVVSQFKSNVSNEIKIAKPISNLNGEEISKIKNIYAKKPDFIEKYDDVITENAYYNAIGTKTLGDNWKCVKFNISKEDEGLFYVTGRNLSGKSIPFLIFFDTSNTVVGTVSLSDSGGVSVSDYCINNIPYYASYVIVNGSKNIIPSVKKKIKVGLEDYVKSYVEAYAEPIKPFSGKTFVFFGTSIPSGSATVDGRSFSIPTYVGHILGATVINESVGSSMARLGWCNAKTSNDNYGWTGHAWQNVFRAMGANLEEKQDLIDNYESKWANLIGGDFEGSSGDGSGTGKPTTLTDKMKNNILNWSYERKLLPYLNGTKTMPDLFIFEHGHNDYDSFSNETMDGSPTVNPYNKDEYDRTKYGDVMAFYFRLIFEANPQAKILLVSHYANDTVKAKKIFDAQKECAEYNKVWFCNVADVIGWSQAKVTVDGVVKTRLAQCLPDGLHPHTDTTGNAIKREAQIIADYIKYNIVID